MNFKQGYLNLYISIWRAEEQDIGQVVVEFLFKAEHKMIEEQM